MFYLKRDATAAWGIVALAALAALAGRRRRVTGARRAARERR